MPCSSGMTAGDERAAAASRLVSEMILYLIDVGIVKSAPGLRAPLQSDASSPYPSAQLDPNTRFLCSVMRDLTEEELDKYVYDGRSPKARKLAAWWEEHQEEDRRREEREKQEAERIAVLEKLTAEQRQVLGL